MNKIAMSLIVAALSQVSALATGSQREIGRISGQIGNRLVLAVGGNVRTGGVVGQGWGGNRIASGAGGNKSDGAAGSRIDARGTGHN